MAAKNQKKKTTISTKPAKRSNKKLIIGAIILLCLLVLGTLSLGKDKITPVKGLSVHSSNSATVTPGSSAAQVSPSGSTTTNTSNTSGSASAKKSSSSTTGTASGTQASSSTSPSPSPTPTPTPVPFGIEPPYGQVDHNYFCGSGSHTFNFTASITANGPGTITYQWVYSDGGTDAVSQLVFASAGTQDLHASWTLTGPQDYSGWAKLTVSSPSETSSKASDAGFSMESACF